MPCELLLGGSHLPEQLWQSSVALIFSSVSCFNSCRSSSSAQGIGTWILTSSMLYSVPNTSSMNSTSDKGLSPFPGPYMSPEFRVTPSSSHGAISFSVNTTDRCSGHRPSGPMVLQNPSTLLYMWIIPVGRSW